MKKVKIMLLSLALFAVVGAALAFKAKFNVKYCTTATVQIAGVWKCPVSGKCPNLLINSTTTVDVVPIFCTTTPVVVAGQSTCFTNDDPALTLDCFATTSLKRDN